MDECLDRLTHRTMRQARLVELRFFGGLTVDEIAEVDSRLATTVKRELQSAKGLAPPGNDALSGGTGNGASAVGRVEESLEPGLTPTRRSGVALWRPRASGDAELRQRSTIPSGRHDPQDTCSISLRWNACNLVVWRADASGHTVLREIGRGGMGSVYLGVRDDDQFQRRVAIKTSNPNYSTRQRGGAFSGSARRWPS